MKAARILIPTIAAVLPFGLTLPAAAITGSNTGSNTATFTITGGALEITVTNTPTNLGRHATTTGVATISGHLGLVVVTDKRGAPAGSGWVASVVSSPFAPTTGPAIPASRISYTAGRIHKTGTARYTADNPTNLKHAVAAVTATDITGNNTATWAPTIHVNIPAGLTAGVYTATITYSVL